jgi:hypothetical protein
VLDACRTLPPVQVWHRITVSKRQSASLRASMGGISHRGTGSAGGGGGGPTSPSARRSLGSPGPSSGGLPHSLVRVPDARGPCSPSAGSQGGVEGSYPGSPTASAQQPSSLPSSPAAAGAPQDVGQQGPGHGAGVPPHSPGLQGQQQHLVTSGEGGGAPAPEEGAAPGQSLQVSAGRRLTLPPIDGSPSNFPPAGT